MSSGEVTPCGQGQGNALLPDPSLQDPHLRSRGSTSARRTWRTRPSHSAGTSPSCLLLAQDTGQARPASCHPGPCDPAILSHKACPCGASQPPVCSHLWSCLQVLGSFRQPALVSTAGFCSRCARPGMGTKWMALFPQSRPQLGYSEGLSPWVAAVLVMAQPTSRKFSRLQLGLGSVQLRMLISHLFKALLPSSQRAGERGRATVWAGGWRLEAGWGEGQAAVRLTPRTPAARPLECRQVQRGRTEVLPQPRLQGSPRLAGTAATSCNQVGPSSTLPAATVPPGLLAVAPRAPSPSEGPS